jgi:cytochrome c-type biogenesis protein CcmH
MTFEQIQAMVDTLTSRLQQNPNDAEGWVMLARSNYILERYAEAGNAYTKAIALLPNDAQLLADYADALAMSNKKDLQGEPLKLIERALKIDPTNLKALSLAGTAAFDRKDYVAAVKYWNKVVQNAPANNEFVQQVQASIEEARQLSDGKVPLTSPSPMQSVGVSPPVATGTATAKASVSGSLKIAANLAGKASPEDTVFIFARAVQGPRMPLAILKKQVKDLPINFTLDDSLAMTPELKLSSFPQVVIGARISKRNDAAAQPGDLQGLTAPVNVGASGIKLEINQVVGNP